MPNRIYIASKTQHASKWKILRKAGYPIISTWIDEAGPDESASLEDLWNRCIVESSTATALVIYIERGEILKGAWVELGAALAYGVPVFAVGFQNLDFSVMNHARITQCKDIETAFEMAMRKT